MSAVGVPLKEFLLEKHIPFECDFELTHDCNQSCIHCFLECPHPGTDADPEMVRQAMAELASMGCVRVGLTGGEPLLHPEFWSLLRKARSLGFAVDVTSNGQLIDAEAARQFSELRVKKVRLSLLGADPETHDSVTRVDGSFQSAVRATEALLHCGVQVEFGCVVLPDNRAQVDRIQSLADEIGAHVGFEWYAVPSLTGKFIPEPKGSLRRGAVPDHRCLAGVSLLAVSPNGDVMPCVMIRETAGNLGNGTIAVTWEQAPVFRTIRSAVCRSEFERSADGASGCNIERYTTGVANAPVCLRWRQREKGSVADRRCTMSG